MISPVAAIRLRLFYTVEVGILVGRVLNVDQHEADLYGLYAPKKSEIMGALTGQSMTPEELDLQLARLKSAGQDTFLMLAAKMQGRWVEPPALEGN